MTVWEESVKTEEMIFLKAFQGKTLILGFYK